MGWVGLIAQADGRGWDVVQLITQLLRNLNGATCFFTSLTYGHGASEREEKELNLTFGFEYEIV